MAILITMPPFLRLFVSLEGEQNQVSQAMSLVLRSITSAATSMVRLIQKYCRCYGYKYANPLLIHHILSASIVHLMNATASSSSFRGHSTRLVRSCLGLLQGLSPSWPLRSQKSINTIKALAIRWNVKFTIPDSDESIKPENLSAHDEYDESDPLHSWDTSPLPNNNSDPTVLNIANQNISGSFDISHGLDMAREAFENDQNQGFDISMVNIPITADDELLGLSQFFQNFENFPNYS